jgi:hypothetical protein
MVDQALNPTRVPIPTATTGQFRLIKVMIKTKYLITK